MSLFGLWALSLSFAIAGLGGQAIATQGNGQGSAPCTSCHGPAGQGSATFPALAGMDAGYLERQLSDIRDGERSAPVMAPSVATLSDAQAQAVAQWFASLEPAPPRAAASAEALELATPLIEVGDWPERDLPACTACHGDALQGAGASFPRIAAQTPEYLSAQLSAFADGSRSDPSGLMAGVAERLSPKEISALSSVIAAYGGVQ